MIKRPRGTQDYLPEKAEEITYLEERATQLFQRYGYRPIITPTFESTGLFTMSIGESTDIVQKEMYTFLDRKERSLTLRPEGTAPIVRAYIENNLQAGPLPVKLFYIGQMFRYERPQAGRYREFWQMGVEAIGSSDPAIDAEQVELSRRYLIDLGIKDLTLKINSMGCRSDRQRYSQELKSFLNQEKAKELCADCQQRVDLNPLRVFDCKQANCQIALKQAPKLLDFVCEECGKNFEQVKGYLDSLKVGYAVEPRLVRGFDYYNRTVFEIILPELGAQDALGGGGRYDYLVEDYGGPKSPAIGFAFGLERIALALKKQGISYKKPPFSLWVIFVDEPSRKAAFELLYKLRDSRIEADMSFDSKSLQSQMKQADKRGVAYSLIVGPEEITSEKYTLRNMKTGKQEKLSIKRVIENLEGKT